MLDANLKAQLKSYLERVTQPIEIVASLAVSYTHLTLPTNREV